VTHPFHPLCGKSLPVLFSKRRGGDVAFVCARGVLGRVTVCHGGGPIRVIHGRLTERSDDQRIALVSIAV
jgi:hypothetical protein